jgi:polyhydroxyalkanoate synthesis regulator phasin
MAEKQHPSPLQPSESADPVTPRRSAGHRVDVRDVVAELAERAQVISQEAGTKVSAAMKDVVTAAAGIAGFAIESARDLVQYMVRRGQMTPEEGERLIREAEAAHEKRSPGEKGKAAASRLASERAAAKAEAAARSAAAHAAPYARPVSKTPVAQPSVPKSSAGSTVAHKAAPPPAPPAKSAASKPAPTVKTKSAKPIQVAKPAKATKPPKKRK